MAEHQMIEKAKTFEVKSGRASGLVNERQYISDDKRDSMRQVLYGSPDQEVKSEESEAKNRGKEFLEDLYKALPFFPEYRLGFPNQETNFIRERVERWLRSELRVIDAIHERKISNAESDQSLIEALETSRDEIRVKLKQGQRDIFMYLFRTDEHIGKYSAQHKDSRRYLKLAESLFMHTKRKHEIRRKMYGKTETGQVEESVVDLRNRVKKSSAPVASVYPLETAVQIAQKAIKVIPRIQMINRVFRRICG